MSAYLHRRGAGFDWIVCAAALFTLSIIATLVWLVPINNRIARMDAARPDAGWRTDRVRWDRFHRVRVATLVLGCQSLLMGVLRAR